MKKLFFTLILATTLSSQAMFRHFSTVDTYNPRVRNFVAGLITGAGVDITLFSDTDLNKYLDAFAIGSGGFIIGNISMPQNLNCDKEENNVNQTFINKVTSWCNKHAEAFTLTFFYTAGFFTGVALGDVAKKNIKLLWNHITRQNQPQQH